MPNISLINIKETSRLNNLFKLSSNYSSNNINKAIGIRNNRDKKYIGIKSVFGRFIRNKN